MKTFISYSSLDRDLIQALAEDLELLDCSVWYDRQLVGGHDWWTEILENIRCADLFILALTSRSLESQACQLEYQYALALKKTVIPICIDEINHRTLPTALSRLQAINYREQDRREGLLLAKAIYNLPFPNSLPSPLPPEPAPPLSPISMLRDLLDAPVITVEDQAKLVADVQFYSIDMDLADDVKILLEMLLTRNDLRPETVQDVLLILNRLEAIRLEPRSIQGHTNCIYKVVFSPDRRHLLSCSADQTARLWDGITGQEIRQYIGHQSAVVTAEFSHDGQTILTGSWDRTARLWKATTGDEIQRFVGHTDAVRATFSPDAKLVATGSSDRSVRLWDATTGDEIQQFVGHESKVLSISMSPNAKLIVSASDDHTARVWDIRTGKEKLVLRGHRGSVRAVVSPNGKQVLTGSDDKTARLWSLETGQEVRQFIGHTAGILGIGFSPDGRYVVTSGFDQSVILWETQTGLQKRVFTGHDGEIWGVAISHDNKFVLSGGKDSLVRLWVTGESN